MTEAGRIRIEYGRSVPKHPPPLPALAIDPDSLDRVMPMHLLVGPTGEVLRLGPGLAKVLGRSATAPGARLFDLFSFKRPAAATSVAQLLEIREGPLRLTPLSGPRRSMKALAIPLVGGAGAILNLSFGISVIDAVRDHNLTAGDFALTDLAVELLYLMEAKTAALEESRRLNTRLQGAKLIAEEQAFTDTLTGLRNRRAMDVVLSRLLSAHERFGLMHLDLDHFKEVNDTHGHAAGDEVLSIVAQRLISQTRAADTVARIGGDEFVLIFHRLDHAATLSEVAERIICNLEEPVAYGEVKLRVSASIGICTTAAYDSPRAEDMLRDADHALYASKRAGRGQYSHFAPSVPEGKGSRLRQSDPLRDGPTCATADERGTGRTRPDDRFFTAAPDDGGYPDPPFGRDEVSDH